MLDKFVGIPWGDKGRTVGAADCWGLTVLVYRTIGIELPHYAEDYTTAADSAQCASLLNGHRSEWSEVTSEIAYDLVLMTEGGAPRHVGIVVTPGLMLHMAPGRESVIENYRTGKYARRVVG